MLEAGMTRHTSFNSLHVGCFFVDCFEIKPNILGVNCALYCISSGSSQIAKVPVVSSIYGVNFQYM